MFNFTPTCLVVKQSVIKAAFHRKLKYLTGS